MSSLEKCLPRSSAGRYPRPWRRKWQTTPVFLPGEFPGQWGLVGHSPWGHKGSHMTERLRQAKSFCEGSPGGSPPSAEGWGLGFCKHHLRSADP